MTLATKNGSLILKDGKLAENCNCCGWYCFPEECCRPCLVVAFQTVGGTSEGCFDLGPFLDAGQQYAGRPYRLVEVGVNCDGFDPGDPDEGYYTWTAWGRVNANGRIDMAQDWPRLFPNGSTTYCSQYPYRGYNRLQIGCENPEAPGSIFNAFYSEDCTDGPCE